jgi:hypothetical protein
MGEHFVHAERFDALAAHVPEVSQDPSKRQWYIGGTDIQHVLSLEPYGCARRLMAMRRWSARSDGRSTWLRQRSGREL